MASVRFRLRPALRGLDAAILIGAGLVGLFYLNRILTPWPLYAGDEGAYLIRALYGDVLAAHPERHPTLQPVGNTAWAATCSAPGRRPSSPLA